MAGKNDKQGVSDGWHPFPFPDARQGKGVHNILSPEQRQQLLSDILATCDLGYQDYIDISDLINGLYLSGKRWTDGAGQGRSEIVQALAQVAIPLRVDDYGHDKMFYILPADVTAACQRLGLRR